jgi:sulfite exporter TauE/SafE/copper chaperone CopZ
MERLYHIAGTHCRSCQILLEQRLVQAPGISSARVDYRTGKTTVRFAHGAVPDETAIARSVQEAGYRLVTAPIKRTFVSHDPADWIDMLIAGCFVFILFLAYRITGLDRLTGGLTAATSASGALVVGLVAGISTCMALIGSLVLALSARHAQRYPYATSWQRIRPNLAFNAGRVLGFAALGGLAGTLGSVFRLEGGLLGFIIVAAGAMMVLLGVKLTGLLPRLDALTLPASLARLTGLGGTTSGYSHTRAVGMGALTFFLPCAFTQTMQVLAISTGSFVQGAAVMAAFALGTAPGLMAIGSIAGFAKGAGGRMLLKTAGVAVLLLGIWNIGNGWNLTGISLAGEPAAIGAAIPGKLGVAETKSDGKQYIATEQNSFGYSPSRLRVKAGIPVVWTITSTNSYTCASSIVIPSLRITRRLQSGPNTIEFLPAKPGTIKYSCSMGMYTGVIEVVQ